MKVLIPTIGSRGDVQPYINLGAELSRAGFEVTIATHPFWKDTTESFGIGFIPMGPDVDIGAESVAAQRLLNIPALLKLLNGIHEAASSRIAEIIDRFDFLVASHMFCGAMEAIHSGKPYVSVTLMPSMIPRANDGKKGTGDLFSVLSDSFYFYAGPWGRIKRRYGLKGGTRFCHLQSPDLNLIPVSAHLFPQDAGWGKNHIVTGIWELPPDDRPLPDELRRFLEKHANPVIVALGAMSFDTERDVGRLRTIIDAIGKTGNAGIIQGFSRSMKKVDVPEYILPLGPFPHNRLFGYGKLIMHHCGFGTATTAVYCGKPSVAVPNMLDQPFWAKKLHGLKLCPKPIPAQKLSEKLLIASINACADSDEIRKNAARMMERMRSENGLKKARELIERFAEEKIG